MGAVAAASSAGQVCARSTNITPRLWLDANLAADQTELLALRGEKLTVGSLRWCLGDHERAQQDFVLWAADLGHRAGKAVKHA